MIVDVSNQYSRLENALNLNFLSMFLYSVYLFASEKVYFFLNFLLKMSLFIYITYKSRTFSLLFNSDTYQEHKLIK